MTTTVGMSDAVVVFAEPAAAQVGSTAPVYPRPTQELLEALEALKKIDQRAAYRITSDASTLGHPKIAELRMRFAVGRHWDDRRPIPIPFVLVHGWWIGDADQIRKVVAGGKAVAAALLEPPKFELSPGLRGSLAALKDLDR